MLKTSRSGIILQFSVLTSLFQNSSGAANIFKCGATWIVLASVLVPIEPITYSRSLPPCSEIPSGQDSKRARFQTSHDPEARHG